MGEEDDFSPRPYQEQLMNLVKEQNTIIYLPTGSGKTFIAVMLIKEMSASLDRGKRTFFMVNTVALVGQQAAYIRRHSRHSVGEYSGDMNVDFWCKEKWQEELTKNQILVMTCQIFLNMLMHGYAQLPEVNLLIFDECHHAVNDQPMRQIMQQFENCPRDLQPRILGLTATLLNSNCKAERVEEEVRSLEKTFLSKVATCNDAPLVERYSTNPDEKVVVFDEYDGQENRPGTTALVKGLELLEKARAFVDAITFEYEQVVSPGKHPPNMTLMNSNRGKINKKLKNLLVDVIFHIKSLGIFGGSQACLAHIIQLERMRIQADDKLVKSVFTALITSLLAVRKLFEDQMADCELKSQIYKYSSSKMLTLLQVLKSAMTKESVNVICDDSNADELSEEDMTRILATETKKTKFCTIVFVERRFTARIVYMVLKVLKEADSDFNHIFPDFIVGLNSNPFNETREGSLEKKWLQDCVKRFTEGHTNVMVASDVLEEGIDIPKCNLVVKFDLPKNYRSYIQSKGRARHRSSKYYIMVPRVQGGMFLSVYTSYQNTESAVRNLLVGDAEDREEPNEEDIAAELYDSLIPPYRTSCSQVSLASAIPLINRYCSVLPQDKFTLLTPLWYLSENGKSVYLQLPMNSKLRDLIKGPEMSSKKMAKRAVALETCKRLHQLEELNEHLLPVEHEDPLEACAELFPLYPEETGDNVPQRGSSKRKEQYRKEFPAALSECCPREGIALYLHAIEQRPVYPRPDVSNNRKLVFYDLLHRSEGFAILSAKKMPKLCNFPIFMNVGENEVHIVSNAACIRVTRDDIRDLEAFNVMLFGQLLKLMKSFLIVDKANMENSYFVVPTQVGNDGRLEIMWDVVRQFTTLPDIQEPTLEKRQELQVTDGLFEGSVVAPWYRGMLGDQIYIVTRVCPELTPASQFPSENYTTYENYYSQKYKLSMINKQQPLLEVKAVSNKINCLRPRSTKLSGVTSKRKRHELQEDFEENLVAELCMRFDFPSVLWLKATCLPTILHRVTYLLLAEELRQNIALDIGVGCAELPSGREWEPLSVDSYCIEHKHDENLTQKESLVSSMTSVRITEPPSPFTSTWFEWGGDKEPVDLDRNMEDVTLVEVLNYDDFVSKPLRKKPEHMNAFNSSDYSHNVSVNCMSIRGDKLDSVARIAILDTKYTGIGPQQCEVLQALTSASANDIVNLERVETLGDSFLKLMSSLYLFKHRKCMNEGELTSIKGKHIGNRNLYYCGVKRKLGGLMKVHDFGPTSDWIPPGMCVYRKLQHLMLDTNASPNFLYEVRIPKEEQLRGQLSKETYESILTKLLSSLEDQSVHSSMENFLSVQTVADKTIADGVEALIGTYLKGSGIRGALRLLGWLHILPADMACSGRLLDVMPSSARLGNGDLDMHLEGVTDLERRLGYKFKDRSFLLQAITHASYSCNRVTDCYQRLEFLGDAVLDFLITCHIYESCGLLNPGELTDLRSALVNNVTFASLTVRNGFHKFIKYSSPKLMGLIDKFVSFQEDHNHAINEEVLILLEEDEVRIAEAVEVPKVLGDLFESLAGAIYLDSGLNLQEVWRVYYRLMKGEIAQFSQRVPKQPVRLLYELATQKPLFVSQKYENFMMVSVGVFIGGKKRWFHGFGETKTQAKRAAAKCALKEFAPH